MWLAVAMTAGGCSPAHQTHRVGESATPMWTAALSGDVAPLREHDGHAHNPQCGHFRRRHGERWVYFYLGRWEYFDAEEERWYAFVPVAAQPLARGGR